MGDPAENQLGRRAFLAGVVAAATAVATAAACSGDDDDSADGSKGKKASSQRDPPPVPDGLPAEVFTLGIASGDPLDDSVILWTRLAADGTKPDGGLGTADPVPVHWEVAADEGFDKVVAEGDIVAEASLTHSVHVDADGLDPDTRYWYRFTVDDRTSPVGQARTTPRPDDDGADSLRFAFASCQNRQDGYWTAYGDLAEQDDLDLVFFLGDYIYEEGPDPRAAQPYRTAAPTDLATYRARWAEHKADPLLQAAHAACPWVATWDDHEVANNYAADIAEGAAPDDNAGKQAFRDRRAAAYQAFYEHTPIRLDPPDGPDAKIYRTLDWGTLARFYVLDGRQYRSDQACGSTTVIAGVGPMCDAAQAEDRTMLGEQQEQWLGEQLDESEATWNVLAQQTVVSAVPFAQGLVNFDQWDGYPAARQRLVEQLDDVSNPVILTGDIHLSAVGMLESEPGSPVAAELVGTSISSGFPLADAVEGLVKDLANVKYVNARQRGYVVCELTPDELRAEYRLVDDATKPDGTVAAAATFVVAEGDPTPKPLET